MSADADRLSREMAEQQPDPAAEQRLAALFGSIALRLARENHREHADHDQHRGGSRD